MAQPSVGTPIQIYSSATSGNVPVAANLAQGELAINVADGKLFYKTAGGTVGTIANASTATGNLPGGNTGTVVYQSATGVTAYLPIGTTNYVLTSSGTGPQYVNPTTITVGSATFGTSYSVTTPSTANTVLSWTGTGFSWVNAPAATTANNLAGGGANTVVYQSSAGTTAYVTNGTTGQVLTATTSGAPTWTTINALPSQTGNAGKYLTTDGTNASWAASGASAGGAIWENTTSITANYTLTTSKNGLSVGPMNIASGVSVTVPSGQRWVVL